MPSTQLAVLVSSAFLLIVDLVLLRYLWARLHLRPGHVAINPLLFLSCCLGCLCLLAGNVLVLGIENAPLALGLALSTILSLLNPVISVCILLTYLFLRPMEMLAPNILTVSMTKVFAGACFFSWGLACVRQRKLLFQLNWHTFFYAALLLWLIVSAVFSPKPEDSFQFLFSSFFPITALYFLITNVIADQRDLDALRLSFTCAILGVVASALVLTVSSAETGSMDQRLGTVTSFGNANDLAALIVIVLPFCALPMLTPQSRWRVRILYGFSLALLFYGLVLAQSRGAFLAVGFGALAYTLTVLKTRWKYPLTIVMILVPLLLMSLISREEGDLSESSEMRQTFILNGLRMAKDHPLFGVGINNYSDFGVLLGQIRATAHSSWVLILAETGFMGLTFFAALFSLALADSWKIRHKASSYLVAVVGYGVAMSFLSHPYLSVPYVLWGFTLAAVRVLNQSTDKPITN